MHNNFFKNSKTNQIRFAENFEQNFNTTQTTDARSKNDSINTI